MNLDASQLVWIDFETRALKLNLKAGGVYRYIDDPGAWAIVLAYAIGKAQAQVWHAGGKILSWDGAPGDLKTAVENPDTILAAWNMGFDRAVWNHGTEGFPELVPERTIDVMVQAGVANLPVKLEDASRWLGGAGKQKDGAKLIALFCCPNPKSGAPPACAADHPDEWQRFLSYAQRDIDAMREVHRRTWPVPAGEWQQYHAFEHINERGVTIDVPFVERAARLTAEDVRRAGNQLATLTDGMVTAVTQAKKLAEWLMKTLPSARMREVLMVDPPQDEDGDDPSTGALDEERGTGEGGDGHGKLSLTRDRITRVLALLDAKQASDGLDAAETRAWQAASLRLYGAGASPKKFARLHAQQINGVLRGQYRFAGAGQTGRMSSIGAQIQNLARDVLGGDGKEEARLVDAIADGCLWETLEQAEPHDMPVARKLALLVRPGIVAAHRKLLVWSDWSAIEARITPWLADSDAAERVLQRYRDHDSGLEKYDNYTVAAGDVLGIGLEHVTRPNRQIGKVTVLACGFGGGASALMNMALNYQINLDEDEAARIVKAWREANPWAPAFWKELWDAAMTAWDEPSLLVPAGKVGFLYHPTYLSGALFMGLPSGRILTYPQLAYREIDELDRKTKQPTGKKRKELSYRRAHNRVKLWHGTFCENAVQATAADILRITTTRIERNPDLAFMPIRMTTHDEIVCEADEDRAGEAKARLRREMLTLPDWADGSSGSPLPLQSEESMCAYYTKVKTALR